VEAVEKATKEKLPERRLRKRMIHTEQVSSSMQLKLILEQREPSYSKRNAKLQYSRPSPHLTNRVYDTSKEDGSK